MDCQKKLREFITVLSYTSLFSGENDHVNNLIEDIMEKLNELEQFIEDDLHYVSDTESEPEILDDDDDDCATCESDNEEHDY